MAESNGNMYIENLGRNTSSGEREVGEMCASNLCL